MSNISKSPLLGIYTTTQLINKFQRNTLKKNKMSWNLDFERHGICFEKGVVSIYLGQILSGHFLHVMWRLTSQDLKTVYHVVENWR